MANAVAALYTSLTLESSQFVANSKRAATAAEKMSNDISKSLTAAKSAVNGFLAIAAVGFAATGIKNALDYASAIGETAQQLGVATTAYQELTYAATQTGVSQQELEAGLARLTRNIGQGAKVFGELGIAIRDTAGNSRATGDVFNDVAAKLGSIQDPAKRAAIEVQLFGKAGQKLDTLLSGGTAAVGALADEAHRLGMVLSPKQIADADAAADAFTRVSNTLSVNIASTVASNAKAIESLANGLGTLITKAGELATWANRNPKLAGTLFGAGGGAVIGGPFGAGVGAVAGFLGGAEFEDGRDRSAQRRRVRGGSNVGLPYVSPVAPTSGASPVEAVTKISKAANHATKDVFDLRGAIDGLEKLGPSIAGEGGVSGIFRTDDQIYNDTIGKLTELGDLASLIQPVELIDQKALDRVEKFGESLSSNLAQALVYGQNLGDALVNSLKAAAAEALASGLFKILTGAIGGGGGGPIASIIGGIFGGFKANGGSVSSGKAYVVGERGPEILTGASGRIIPNHALGGGSGGGMTVNVDARGSNDPAAVRAQVMLGIAQAAPALVAAARGDTISTLRRPSLAGGRG